MALKYFQCFLDEIAKIFTLSLAVVDSITRIYYNKKYQTKAVIEFLL